MNYTKRDKTNVLLGLLGYAQSKEARNRNYQTAYNLLNNNNFDIERIIKLHYALRFDEKTETSYISLAGETSTIKIKMSDINQIAYYVESWDVNISIG